MKDRGSFGSNFGAIAAATGSAIGLGNIWRFPYVVGENGGAAFILVYLVIVIALGIPMLMTELSLGRYTQKNVFGSFRQLSPKGHWYIAGLTGILAAFTILSFYSVVAGWTIAFLEKSIANNFAGLNAEEVNAVFKGFVNGGFQPIIYLLIFVFLTSAIVFMGIEKGIEKYNKILMPLLFVILVLLCANSFSLSGFNDAIKFLFTPDFSKITTSVILGALGQAFFSLSLGMGCMMTYGSYMNKKSNLFRTSSTVAIADVSIAILAGIAIFPAVFSYNIAPASGPELVFITLPNIFSQMSGGYFFSILFFILLIVAALTSSVSLMEVFVAFFVEEVKIARSMAVILSSLLVSVSGILIAISQMENSTIRVMGQNLFNFLDNISSSYMLPFGGFLIILFAGWVFKDSYLKKEISSDGKYGTEYYPLYKFAIKFIAPIAIIIIFLSQIGLI